MGKKKAAKKKAKSKALTIRKPTSVAFFNKEQQGILNKPTPKDCVYYRPGRGGTEFTYVSIGYMTGQLDKVCLQHGMIWSFNTAEVVPELISKTGHIVVRGKLIIMDSNGRIVRTLEQYGSADVKILKGTSKPVDLGDDFKAAASDALKKCCSMLGIARDIYFKDWDVVRKDYDDEPTKSDEKKKKPKADLVDAEVVDDDLVSIRKTLHADMKKLLKTKSAMMAVLGDTVGKDSFMDLTKADIKKLQKAIKK